LRFNCFDIQDGVDSQEKMGRGKKLSIVTKKESKVYQNLDDSPRDNKHKSKKKKSRSKSKYDRNGSTTSSSSDAGFMVDEAFRQSLQSGGTKTIVEMPSDGNCLFRALSDQLYGDYGQRYFHMVRNDICDYMESRESEFVHFLVLDDNDAKKLGEEDAKSYQHYMDQMRRDGEWGGNVELVAAARLYQRDITVYSPGGAFSIECGSMNTAQDQTLSVSYHEGDHYNSVRVLGRRLCAPPVKAVEAQSPTEKVKKSKHSKNKKAIAPSPNFTSKNTANSALVTSPSTTASNGNIRLSQSTPSSSRSQLQEELLPSTEESTHETEVQVCQAENSVEDTKSTSCTSPRFLQTLSVGPDENLVIPTPDVFEVTTEGVSPSTVTHSTDAQSEKYAKFPIKRNEFCPCKSGLRYKKCCHNRVSVPNSETDHKSAPPVPFTLDGEFRVLKI